MNISSAYLFATQISPGDTPEQEVVFFENGVFNSRHIPTGFDFENNVLRIVAEREDSFSMAYFEQASKWDFENGLHADHLDDGTTFLINSYAANNEESFTLDHNSGCLVFNHPNNRTAIDRANAYAQIACIVPVNNLAISYDYICMRCRYVATAEIANNSGVGISIWGRNGNAIYEEEVMSANIKYDLYDQGWVDLVIDNKWGQQHIDFIHLYFDAHLESRDFPIGDIPFQIEVSKIWFTNTQPE